MFDAKSEMYWKKIELSGRVFDFNGFWRIGDMIPDSASEYLLWTASIALFSIIAFRALRFVVRMLRIATA